MLNVPSHSILERGLNIPIPYSDFKMMLTLKAYVLCNPRSTQQPEGFNSDSKSRESMLAGGLGGGVAALRSDHCLSDS